MTDYTYPGNGPIYGLVLNAGDVATVNSGGAESATINDGGKLLAEGGTSYGIQVNSGGLVQVDAGHVDSVTLAAGAQEIVNGGQSNSPYVNGGTLTVNAGGTVAFTNVTHGGVEYLHGSNISSTAYDGGRIVLDQPGYAGDQPTSSSNTPNYLGTLQINSGGTLEIVNGATSGVTLNPGGTIVVDPVKYDSSVTQSYNDATGVLTITGAASTYHLGVYEQPGVTGFTLAADPISGNVAVTATASAVVCFCAGSMIGTPRGDVAIEDLWVGAEVLTRGASGRVRWIGRALVRSGIVTVRANALADGIPYHDLRVTPGHSFLFGDVLIPIGELVNGRTIVREDGGYCVVFHLELDRHDILLANGAAAESYRDDGNRASFSERTGQPNRAWQAPCAPVVTAGAVVDQVWQALVMRAGEPGAMLTDDPDLHLIADGRRIEPYARDGDLFRFALDGEVSELHLASRHVVPALAGLARDSRRLGVAVRRLSVETAHGLESMEYDAPELRNGFHDAEDDGALRWTDGLGHLPSFRPSPTGPVMLAVELGCRTPYLAN